MEKKNLEKNGEIFFFVFILFSSSSNYKNMQKKLGKKT